MTWQTLNAFGQGLFVLLATYFLHSGVVVMLGMSLARILRKFGPVVQSHVLRTTFAACLLLFVIPHFNSRPALQISTSRVDGIALIHKAQRTPAVQTSRPPDTTPVAQEPVMQTSEPESGPAISFSAALAALWLVGVAMQLAFLGGCHWQLVRLRRLSSPVGSAEVLERLQARSAQFGVRAPRILENAVVGTPFLAGVFHPTIFLRNGDSESMDQETLEMTLLHELAHVKHRDCLWAVLRRVASAALWVQPLVWVLSRRAEQAAEEAADYLAVSEGISGVRYASCLLRLAEENLGEKRLRVAAVGVAETRSLVGSRIERILRPSRQSVKSLSERLRLTSICVAAGAALLAASLVACVSGGQKSPSIFGVNLASGPQQRGTPWTPPAGYEDHFKLAKKFGWSIEPARYIPNQWTGKGGQISEQDRHQMAELFDIIQPNIRALYGSRRPPRTKLEKLKAFLVVHPENFYAEFLIAHEYWLQGERANFEKYYFDSLRRAPLIVAGRIQFEDGSPFSGREGLSKSIAYGNEPTRDIPAGGGVMESQTQLNYDIVTDENGCFYLPAFPSDAWVGDAGVSFYQGTEPFESNELAEYIQTTRTVELGGSKVILLPPNVFRPKIKLKVPGGWQGAFQKPAVVSGDQVTVSWEPVPRAAKYRFSLQERYSDGSAIEEPADVDKLAFLSETSQPSVTIPLNAPELPFWYDRSYALRVSAYAQDGTLLTRSNEYCFGKTPEAPPALNEENVRKWLPGGFELTAYNDLPNGNTELVFSFPKKFSGDDLRLLERRLRVFRRYRSGFDRSESKVEDGVTIITFILRKAND